MTYTHSLWDHAAGINGASLEDILASLPDGLAPNAPVVLITDDETGSVVQLQPFDPTDGQPFVSEEAANAWGEAAVEARNAPAGPGQPGEPPAMTVDQRLDELTQRLDDVTNMLLEA